jgi:hypothetical protein
MVTFLFAALLSILGFLCFTGRTALLPEASSLNLDRDVGMPSAALLGAIRCAITV